MEQIKVKKLNEKKFNEYIKLDVELIKNYFENNYSYSIIIELIELKYSISIEEKNKFIKFLKEFKYRNKQITKIEDIKIPIIPLVQPIQQEQQEQQEDTDNFNGDIPF